jgi:hypothetical protein
MTTDRKDIERDQVWLTRDGRKATVISTAMPDEKWPVLAWTADRYLGYVYIQSRLDGTVNSRPGVAHPDDLVERLS